MGKKNNGERQPITLWKAQCQMQDFERRGKAKC